MEPITHILTGACLSRIGLNRGTALATATLVLAAESPDIDLLYRFGGPVLGFQHHRGWTHSLLAVPLMAALSLALILAAYRLLQTTKRTGNVTAVLNPVNPPVRWRVVYAYACLAVLSHLLLDYSTSYGIRPFEPFSFKWYSWSILYTADPLIWFVLSVGLILPAICKLSGRDLRWQSHDRRWALLAVSVVGKRTPRKASEGRGI